MTPAARNVVEAVHSGAVLTMHYRRDDSGENVPRFVLEPKGKPVFAPTAIMAVRSGHLKAADDGLPGLAVTQTWTAGEPMPPVVAPPPFIEGSNVRDTTVRGLSVKFDGDVARILHAATGERLFDPIVMACGRRAFVERVNGSELRTVDWSALAILSAATPSDRAAAKLARAQIVGAAL